MKTIFFAVALMIPMLVLGQEIKVAPVVGLGVSTVLNSQELKDEYNYSSDISWKSRPSIKGVIGAWVDYSINDKVGLRSGLLFNFKGETLVLKYNEDGEKGKATLKQKYMYLELPFLLNYKIGESGYKLLFGPSINFALSAKATSTYRYEYDGDVEKGSESEQLNIGTDPRNDDIKPLDVSLNLGLAKDFEIKGVPVEVSLFVTPSLTKFTTITKLSSDYFSRHFGIGFRAAYFFSLSN